LREVNSDRESLVAGPKAYRRTADNPPSGQIITSRIRLTSEEQQQ
jgi:hypothetical protein